MFFLLNLYLKAMQEETGVWVGEFFKKFPAVLRNLLKWVLAAFLNYVIALMSLGQITRN
jgi:hypothetical protein